MSVTARQQYRKLNTRRGVYFVPWSADAVIRLLVDERLTPAEMITHRTADTHQLIRDLYLLSCAGALGGTANHSLNTALLAQYAHTLRGFLNPRR